MSNTNLQRRIEALERRDDPTLCGCIRFGIRQPDGTTVWGGGRVCQHGHLWPEPTGDEVTFTIDIDRASGR
jgi:hypothetical protein